MFTSVVSSSSGVVSITRDVGVPEYGVLAVITLILLLSAKEIVSSSDYWNKAIKCSFAMGIFPLMISFIAIVFLKISENLK